MSARNGLIFSIAIFQITDIDDEFTLVFMVSSYYTKLSDNFLTPVDFRQFGYVKRWAQEPCEWDEREARFPRVHYDRYVGVEVAI